MAEQHLWISGYALRPRRLSGGQWIWLQPYEWRWSRPRTAGPLAIRRSIVETRRATAVARRGRTGAGA